MTHASNHLIDLLPLPERQRFLARCEQVPLVMSEVLGRAARPTCFAYFPVDGFISQVAQLDGRLVLEVGMVGREGLLGAQLALGVAQEPLHAMVQSPGHAYRLKGQLLKDEFDRAGALQQLLLRYTQALLTQMAQRLACNRLHSLDQQFCRWLLQCFDLLPANQLLMTQEMIANMLGVRRGGVSEVASHLKHAGLISYHRGRITLLNRTGLEDRACECYAVLRDELQRLLPETVGLQGR